MAGLAILAAACAAALWTSVVVLGDVAVMLARSARGLLRGSKAAYAAALPAAERRWHARRASRARP